LYLYLVSTYERDRPIGTFILIVWGGILVLKPNLFVRGIWKRTDIAQRLLSPKGYLGLYTDARSFLVAVHFGVYNVVRKHHTLGTTPSVAAGLEEKPWSLEGVVEMTADYMRRKDRG
jgi:hypothetical protein